MDALETIQLAANRLAQNQNNLRSFMEAHKKVQMSHSDLESKEIDRLYYNHALNKTQLSNALSVRKNTLNDQISRAIDEGIIPPPIKSRVAHFFTRPYIHALIKYMGLPTYRNTKKPTCITVANQKGGIAKSTTTITLGVAAALDLSLRAKVLLIDLDPQGSSGTNLQDFNFISEEESFLTGIDLILGEFEKVSGAESGDEYREALELYGDKISVALNAAKPTHLPNLHVLPAFPSDERLTDVFGAMNTKQKLELFKNFNEIIDGLKEEYDIILIDTPPQDASYTWLGLDVANFLLVPIKPTPFDIASTSNFMGNLNTRIGKLPSKGLNLKIWKAVITSHDKHDENELREKAALHRALGSSLYSSPILKSGAFTAASGLNRTVLDIKSTEGVCPVKQLSTAKDSFGAFYQQFASDIESFFSHYE